MNRDQNFALNIRWPFQNTVNCLRAFGLLFILLVLVYANSFHASWHYDDLINIVENAGIRINNLSWPEVEKSFYALSEIEKNLYGTVKSGHVWSRPLSYFSFAVNYYFGGLNVFGYHVVNFGIHYLSAMFLFLFLYNLLQLPKLAGRYGGCAYSAALLSAALWAIHPIQVTAVTYIVQRMASMVALFYMMSMYFYLKGRTSSKIHTTVFLYFLCLVSFLFAIGAKQNAAMLPLSILLLDLFFIQGITRGHTLRSLKILIVMAVCALLILLFYLRYDPSTIDFSCRIFDMSQRLLSQPRVFFYYISLLLYPLNSRLMLVHEFDVSKTLFDPWTTLFALAALVLLIGLALMKARKMPLFSYGILFFFINHLIEGSFFSLELVYEHRNYLPSMLFFFPFVIGLFNTLEYFKEKKVVFMVIVSALTAMMIIWGVATAMYNDIFKDEVTLWRDNAYKTPGLHLPHHSLGLAYLKAGRLAESYEELQKALQSADVANVTNKYRTYIVFGQYYVALGDLDKVLYYTDLALHFFPNIADLYHIKGIILLEKTGAAVVAEAEIRKALSLKPTDARFHVSLGTVLLKNKDYGDSIRHAQTALRLNPDAWQAYYIISDVFKDQGRQVIAEHFRQVGRRLQLDQQAMVNPSGMI